MKLIRLLGALFAALVLAAAAAPAAANPLDDYVAKADPAFGWKVVRPISGPGWKGAVLEMTSQRWSTETLLPGQDLWKHWMTIVVPDGVAHDKAFLYITGGDKDDAAPAKPEDWLAGLARDTKSVTVELRDVPNQPLRFSDSPDKARVEDDIIAYLQARYGKAQDPKQLLRLPMVKSGVQAMTAAQQYLASEAGGGLKIDGFTVAGASKRGWTTWLVGAVDRRVVAIIPAVISVLSVEDTAIHHWRAMGYFSPALEDYVNHRLIPDMIGKPALAGINRIEDPINYQNRRTMKIPKYVVNAVGDEYFPPDNTRYGYHKVANPKRLRMVPNAEHSLDGSDAIQSITAFHDAVITGRQIPDFQWGVRRDGAIVVRSKVKPMAVRLWQGTNPKARDFRLDTLGAKAFTSTNLDPQKDGSYVGAAPKPTAGYTAYFVEVLYPSGTRYPFKFTTEVQVTPDVLPYRWEDAKPITRPETTD